MAKSRENKAEITFYAGIWTCIFALVPLILFSQWVTDQVVAFDTHALLMIWLGILPFFLLFLFHNWLAAPLLVKKKKIGAYIVITLALLVVFAVAVFVFNPGPGLSPTPLQLGPPPTPDLGEPAAPHHPQGMKRRYDFEILKCIIGMLIVGANLGVKYYFQHTKDRRRLQELQTENLRNQLGYLKYQVNPHFFMNTLNNIHALVELDPEKAKESIEEFSKLMRHVLYEGDQPTVPLSQEMEFLQHFISLMRLRYDESVHITLDLPEEAPEAVIPPITLATFAENAFKHGVSYTEPSSVKISLREDNGKIVFKCFNSKIKQNDKPGERIQEEGGVGLNNIRQRLQLIYGNNYLLHLEDHPAEYDVLLIIPVFPTDNPILTT